MNKLLKVILIILCVAAVVHLVFLFNTNGSFWVGFWQNFYSDLLVGIAITYLVTWYISRSQKLDLELKVFVEGTKPDKRVLNFVLLNKGNVGFDAQQV